MPDVMILHQFHTIGYLIMRGYFNDIVRHDVRNMRVFGRAISEYHFAGVIPFGNDPHELVVLHDGQRPDFSLCHRGNR